MMQRRHAEDASTCSITSLRVLEPRHLDHHRQGFDHEDTAHDEQHDLLAHDDRDRAQSAAQRECADIAHEDLRRIRVEP
ncbi:hypothetical protein D3C86_2194680 [compost metagenome]